MKREYPEQKQRVAVCYSQWKKAHGEKGEDKTPKPSGSVDFVPTEAILSKSDDEDYIIPLTIEDLKEGHIVKYKDKIGKVVKVIND